MTPDAKPSVARLFLYPVKSLDPVAVESVTVLVSGALQRDREFALFDQGGQYVNGKGQPRIHQLRSQFHLETQVLTLGIHPDQPSTPFQLPEAQPQLEQWLSDYFNFPVQLRQNLERGFPDDIASPGPTIISTATLEAVASWYPGLEVEEVRRRFRANIEVENVPAFWEDCLFAEAGQTVDFQIGAVTFMGINPCQRCVVITRDPQTGAAYPNFQKTFVTKRHDTLPGWTVRSRFNHFYRLGINTRRLDSGMGLRIQVGDRLELLQT
ncbi:MAG: MOSC domain-containing protein [Oscillatoriales cyanobacterium RM2_1_1]|nr:MOSC domain-containing protein [Oscillatoriales cyanobacterium SM2_3_0]NJO44447.1 MOSC domain-containing protein [Oscillatoriales cyanobacterium RM2_1_1]